MSSLRISMRWSPFSTRMKRMISSEPKDGVTPLALMTDERRVGHSKLVYNKTTRTIDTVDPNPTAPAEPQGDIRDPIWDERNGQEPVMSDSLEERARLVVDNYNHEPVDSGSTLVTRIAAFVQQCVEEERKWRPTHRHWKGHLYRVVAEGTLEADMAPCVVYDDAEGRTWVRTKDDFEEIAYGVPRFTVTKTSEHQHVPSHEPA